MCVGACCDIRPTAPPDVVCAQLPSRCAGNAKLWVRAPFRAEKMTPSAKLDRLRMAVRPHEVAMTPLPGPRDALPDGRTAHAMVLTYKFSLAEDGKVTPTLPMLNRCVPPPSASRQQIL